MICNTQSLTDSADEGFNAALDRSASTADTFEACTEVVTQMMGHMELFLKLVVEMNMLHPCFQMILR